MTQQFHSWVYIRTKQKTLIQKDTCTPTRKAALFTIANTWKQLKCPSTEDCLRCGIYTQWNITQVTIKKE